MTFPRSPSKPVSGKLKLSIKAPTSVEVTTDPGVSVPPGSNDSDIKFTLPPGFGIDSNLDMVVARQQAAARKSVEEIEKRYGKCAPCRSKGFWQGMTLSIRQAIDQVDSAFKGKLTVAPSLVISHEKNGDITFEVRHLQRALLVISRTAQKDAIMGTFEKSSPVDDQAFDLDTYNKKLLWVIGHE